MAVLGRLLFASAERLDLPDLLSIDSFTAGDFKFLLKGLIGDDKPLVLRGFDVINPGDAIGSQSLSIQVADSVVLYPGSLAGPFFHGLEEGNANAQPLVPELKKNATNFVFLTFSTFDTAKDTRAFWDPDLDGGLGGEFTQDINTESVLQVEVNVSVSAFPDNTIPVCRVVVGPSVIESIQDAREQMFRLGEGGVNPDPFSTFNFRDDPSSAFARNEPPTLMSSALDPNPFQGGDKNILSLKEWMDVVMTKLLELGGTTFWYENSAAFGAVNMFLDALGRSFKSKGQWEHSDSTPGLLTWTEDIHLKYAPDDRDIIIRAANKTLQDEEVMYVELQREAAINTGNVSVEWFNGLNFVNGVVAAFENLEKGDWIKKKGDPSRNYRRTEEFFAADNLGGGVTSPALARSIRLSDVYEGANEVQRGVFTKGSYDSSEIFVVARSEADPLNNNQFLEELGGNMAWLAIRSDTIMNVSDITTTSLLLIDITEADGVTAKVTATAHGLVDGDRVTIADSVVGYNGTFVVDVTSVDDFYIDTTQTGDELGVANAYYAIATTTTRDIPGGFNIESAQHSFEDNQTITIAGTASAFDAARLIKQRTPTTFSFAVGSAIPNVSTGTATLARINVRSEFGMVELKQGEGTGIGEGDTSNVMSFIGMASIAETNPTYNLPPGYNTLNGQSSYNGDVTDNLTVRAAKLTAMMADKAQDKTIKLLLDNIDRVTNIQNVGAQDITFTALDGGTKTMHVVLPNSANNGTVTLAGTLSLNANQAAYFTIDRNAAFSVASLAALTVADIDSIPLDENIYVFAVRLANQEVWLWDGVLVEDGETEALSTHAGLIDRQDRNIKLIRGGTWAWDLGTDTLTNSANAFVQIPGLAEARNRVLAQSIVLPNDGDVAFVNINRATGPVDDLTVSVAAIASVNATIDTIIIARRLGDVVFVGDDSDRLIDGESQTLDASASDQTLTFIGADDEADDDPDYSSENVVTDGDSLTTAIGKLDGAAGAASAANNQDRNLKLIGGGAWTWVLTTDEVQRISFGGIAPEIGDFQIEFDGQTTASISFTADNLDVQSALEALANIGPGNVSVTGSFAGNFTITFIGALADTDVAEVTIPSNDLHDFPTFSGPSPEIFRATYAPTLTSLLPSPFAAEFSLAPTVPVLPGPPPVATLLGDIPGTGLLYGPGVSAEYTDPAIGPVALIGTLSFKVNIPIVGGPGGPQHLVHLENGGAVRTVITDLDTSSGIFTANFFDDTGTPVPGIGPGLITPPGTFTPGVSHDVEVAWNYLAGDYRLFVDGILHALVLGAGPSAPRTASLIKMGDIGPGPLTDPEIIDDIQLFDAVVNPFPAPGPAFPTPRFVEAVPASATPSTLIEGSPAGVNGELSFGGNPSAAFIQVPGLQDARNTIPVTESPICLGPNEVAYVDINRTAGGDANLTVNTVAVSSFVNTDDRVVIARRDLTDILIGTSSFRLRDGEFLELDGALQEINRLLGQFRITAHETNADQVRIAVDDTALLDGGILSQELGSLLTDFASGAVVDFSTGDVFESDGTTPLGVNFTPFAVPAGEFFWYGISLNAGAVTATNRQLLQVNVDLASAADAVEADAPFPTVSGVKKLGAVQVVESGGDQNVNIIRRFGVGAGGSGAGEGNELLERLKDQLQGGSFENLTANTFLTDGEDLIDPASTATFQAASKTFKFSAALDVLLSIDLLDSDFLSEAKDVGSIELSTFWNDEDPTQIDPDATYEVSRDGGSHYQPMTLTRVGNTETFQGTHIFDVETDSTTLDEYAIGNADSSVDLDDGSVTEAVSQEFVTVEDRTLEKVSLTMKRTGSPAGNYVMKLLNDAAGIPSTAANAEIFVGPSTAISSIPLVDTEIELDLSDLKLAAGTYHIVFETDATYQASYVVATDLVEARSDASAPTVPLASTLTGGVWSTHPTDALIYKVTHAAEAFATIDEYDVSNADAVRELNTTTQQRIAQPFTLTDTEVIRRVTLETNKTGSPTGGLFVAIAEDDGGSPGTTLVESVISDIADISSGNGTVDVRIPTTALAAGTYHLVIRTDAAYKSIYVNGVTELRLRTDSSAPAISDLFIFDGATYSAVAGEALTYNIAGRNLDLRLRITSSIEAELKGYGIFYELSSSGVVGGVDKRQIESFDGIADNENEFTIDKYLPDPDLLKVYERETGQVYVFGAFSLDGHKVIFPADTFNKVGTVTLLFDQNNGGSFDNSDKNAALIAANFLGSTDAEIDRSQNGRGIFLRRPDGVLVEVAVDNDDNIVVYSV